MARLGRPPAEQIAVTCACCGKDFTKPAYAVKNNTSGRFFCSLACRNKTGVKPRTIQERPCEVCGVSFRPRVHRAPGRFCSRACQDVWQARNKVERTCEQCGKTFTLSPSWEKFRPGRFCSKSCEGLSRITTGRELNREHNGRPVTLTNKGYVLVWEPDHPAASHGRVLEHRIVAERTVGRYLLPGEEVNHKNRIKTDNRPENLEVLTNLEHAQVTAAQQRADREELAEYRRRYGPLPRRLAGKLIAMADDIRKVFLVIDNEDYYSRTIDAIYSTREAAEAHIAKLAAKRKPFPGSDLLSIQDFTERSIEEWDVLTS